MTGELDDPHYSVIQNVGLFGLKTLLTLNAGAAIVLLAFLGNVAHAGDGAIPLDLAGLKWAMALFLAGIAAAMVSVTATYLLAQMGAVRHPALERMGFAVFVGWMVAPAVAAFGLFAAGFLRAVFSIG